MRSTSTSRRDTRESEEDESLGKSRSGESRSGSRSGSGSSGSVGVGGSGAVSSWGSALPATDEDDTGRRGDVMDATWGKQLSTQLHVLQEVRAASNGLQTGF